MKNEEDIKALLDYFRSLEAKELTFDEEEIFSTYHKDTDQQSLAIKVLSVFGGILSSLAFLIFLFMAGLYNSEMGLMIFGIICVAGAIWINKVSNKIILDTISVSAFLVGFLLLAAALTEMNISSNVICIGFVLIALISLVITQNYILSFTSVLIICGSVLVLIFSNNAENLIHLYVSIITLLFSCWFLLEARIVTLNASLSKLYNPVRIGLLFSLLAGLSILGRRDFLSISHEYIWLSSIVNIATIVFLLFQLFDVLNITKVQLQISICVLSVVLLLPTVLSPAISGALLIILLSFLTNYRTGLVIGVIAFIYFVCQYYYDLHFTLLTKSILMFSSGIMFLGLYLFAHQKLMQNEKV